MLQSTRDPFADLACGGVPMPAAAVAGGGCKLTLLRCAKPKRLAHYAWLQTIRGREYPHCGAGGEGDVQ